MPARCANMGMATDALNAPGLADYPKPRPGQQTKRRVTSLNSQCQRQPLRRARSSATLIRREGLSNESLQVRVKEQ